MNDVEGKPCQFCGEAINAAEGYTVEPKNGEPFVYHRTKILRCYEEQKRKELEDDLLP